MDAGRVCQEGAKAPQAPESLIYTSADSKLPQMVRRGINGISNGSVFSKPVQESASLVLRKCESIMVSFMGFAKVMAEASSLATDRPLLLTLPEAREAVH